MPDLTSPKPDLARAQAGGHRALWLLVLFAVELAAITIFYQFWGRIECHATEAETMCRGLRSLVARALCISALMAILCWARPGLARRFVGAASASGSSLLWPVLHGLGLIALLYPIFAAQGRDMAPDFAAYAPFWAAGAVLAAAGGLMWLIAPLRWRGLLGGDARALLWTVAIGAVLPDLADLILPLWYHWPALTLATFRSVALVLQLLGAEVFVDAPSYIIGLPHFAVHVAQQCSGVEGLALVTGFTALYAVLFRHDIHVWRYWMVVLPLGLALSWTLNVVRIAGLILIGEHISPSLAVNGFHSFAGTLFFTILALGLMWFVQSTPWLHRRTAAAATGPAVPAAPPLRHDWAAARLLPFCAFMLVSSFVAALFEVPEAGYPVKTLVMLGSVWLFWPVIKPHLFWPSAVSLGAGALVGALWVMSAPVSVEGGAELAELLARLPPLLLGLWVICRLLGTIVLVPVIEELFFRGYLLARFKSAGPVMAGIGLILTSLAFGILHGRWLEGLLSGLIFGVLYLWRGRLSDAVGAHIAANLVVAGFALLRADWSLI